MGKPTLASKVPNGVVSESEQVAIFESRVQREGFAERQAAIGAGVDERVFHIGLGCDVLLPCENQIVSSVADERSELKAIPERDATPEGAGKGLERCLARLVVAGDVGTAHQAPSEGSFESHVLRGAAAKEGAGVELQGCADPDQRYDVGRGDHAIVASDERVAERPIALYELGAEGDEQCRQRIAFAASCRRP